MSIRADRVVYTDADNTLWDTNSLYANAQLQLLSDVEAALGVVLAPSERLLFVRQRDQAIALTHELGLQYPPRLLVQALAEDALEGSLIAEIEDSFIGRLRHSIPELRTGVKEGLARLQEASIPVRIVTEGREASCRRILSAHRLDHLVKDVLSSKKSLQLFFQLVDSNEKQYYIGDQLDVDIAFARQAGFTTIYFPGGFVPGWATGTQDVSDYRITSFEEVTDIVLARRVWSHPRI